MDNTIYFEKIKPLINDSELAAWYQIDGDTLFIYTMPGEDEDDCIERINDTFFIRTPPKYAAFLNLNPLQLEILKDHHKID